MRLLQLALFCALVLPGAAGAAESANDVLARSAHTYASLQSYEDSGVVLMYLLEGAEPNQTRFRTTFARPEQFKFAWVSQHPFPPLRGIEWKSAIWTNADGAFTRYGFGPDPERATKVESLRMAVAGATGVSQGSVYTIAALLLPALGPSPLRELTGARMAQAEIVEGVGCHHIIATDRRFGEMEFWIGADDRLLRKMRSTYAGIRHEEIRRDILINRTLAADAFAAPR
jgi:hypothetical protein